MILLSSFYALFFNLGMRDFFLILKHDLVGILCMPRLPSVKLVTMHYALPKCWRRKVLNFCKPYQNHFSPFTFALNLIWLLTANVSTQAFHLPPWNLLMLSEEIENPGLERWPQFGETVGNALLPRVRQLSYFKHFPFQQTQIFIWQLEMV